MLLDVTCCTGSIPSELGKLRALQRLYLSSNQLTGESNVCLGVSGTFIVSVYRGRLSCRMVPMSQTGSMTWKKFFFFVQCSSNASIPSKTTILGALEIFSLHFSSSKGPGERRIPMRFGRRQN